MRDRAAPFQVGRARLQADQVAVAQAQLGGVLDGDDAFAVGDEVRQQVEQVVLPEPVPPEMTTLRRCSTQVRRNAEPSRAPG